MAKVNKVDMRNCVSAIMDWLYTPEPFRKENPAQLAHRLGISRAYIYKIIKQIPAASEPIHQAIIESLSNRYAVMLDSMMTEAIGGNVDARAQLIGLAGKKLILSGNDSKREVLPTAVKVNDAMNGQFEIAKPPIVNVEGRSSAVLCTNIGANTNDNTNKCTNTIQAAVDDGGKHA